MLMQIPRRCKYCVAVAGAMAKQQITLREGSLDDWPSLASAMMVAIRTEAIQRSRALTVSDMLHAREKERADWIPAMPYKVVHPSCEAGLAAGKILSLTWFRCT